MLQRGLHTEDLVSLGYITSRRDAAATSNPTSHKDTSDWIHHASMSVNNVW